MLECFLGLEGVFWGTSGGLLLYNLFAAELGFWLSSTFTFSSFGGHTAHWERNQGFLDRSIDRSREREGDFSESVVFFLIRAWV